MEPRIERSEEGLAVSASPSHPLPVPIVYRQVLVAQLLGEVLLALAPVNAQVLDQKTAGDHPQPVVHLPGFVELPHSSVHHREPRPSVLPGLQMLIVFDPINVVLGLGERPAYHLGILLDHHLILVAPNERADERLQSSPLLGAGSPEHLAG